MECFGGGDNFLVYAARPDSTSDSVSDVLLYNNVHIEGLEFHCFRTEAIWQQDHRIKLKYNMMNLI